MNKKHDVSSGAVFGRLTVVGTAPFRSGQREPAIECRCSCGTTREFKRGALTSGNTRSCGCLRRELRTAANVTHGLTGAPEHRVWISMRERCENPRARAFGDYGGRGIAICKGWDSFASFLADMGPRPHGRTAARPAYTIDRIDNNGGYWCWACSECVSLARPANCRWADRQQQNSNRRDAVMVTARGDTLNVTEWSRRSGLSHHTIGRRIARGWTPEQAITKYPGRPHRPPVTP